MMLVLRNFSNLFYQAFNFYNKYQFLLFYDLHCFIRNGEKQLAFTGNFSMNTCCFNNSIKKAVIFIFFQ